MLHLKVAYFFMHRYDFLAILHISGASYIFFNELVYLSVVGTLLTHLSRDVVFSLIAGVFFASVLWCRSFGIFGTPSLTHTPLSLFRGGGLRRSVIAVCSYSSHVLMVLRNLACQLPKRKWRRFGQLCLFEKCENHSLRWRVLARAHADVRRVVYNRNWVQRLVSYLQF